MLGANSREKVWEQFPDTVGKTFCFEFLQVLKTRIFQISDRLSDPMNIFCEIDQISDRLSGPMDMFGKVAFCLFVFIEKCVLVFE